SAAPSEVSPKNRLRGRSPRSNRNIQRSAVQSLIRCSPPDVQVFRFRAPASPAQRFLGGGFGRGAKPPAEGNVQAVRLACGPRAPPRSWTLLSGLPGAAEKGPSASLPYEVNVLWRGRRRARGTGSAPRAAPASPPCGGNFAVCVRTSA